MKQIAKQGPGRPRTKTREAPQTSKSLRRALTLLRELAKRDETGARLAELAEATGIHVATAHRLLASLQEEGMVWSDPDTRIYNLGYEIIKMGGSARRFAISDRYHPVLVEVAQAINDNVYLTVPAGNDGVVVDRVEGNFAHRLVSPEVGSRRPLGIGASAIAILAAYPPDMSRRIYEENLPHYGGITWITAEQIWEEVQATLRRGYTVVKGHMIAEATAVAVSLPDDEGMPMASIAVMATNSRMMPERRAAIVATIREAVARHAPESGRLRTNGG
jgi:DNA-binding IclR family transcriptional regulator